MPQQRRMVRRGAEVSGVGRSPERAEPSIDLLASGGPEGVSKAVADPLQGGHVTGHAGDVLGRGVDEQLLRPELEAGGVDLGGGPVAQLEVELGLGDIDGRRAGRSGRASLDRAP